MLISSEKMLISIGEYVWRGDKKVVTTHIIINTYYKPVTETL